jgi:hypothetical protein
LNLLSLELPEMYQAVVGPQESLASHVVDWTILPDIMKTDDIEQATTSVGFV